MKGSLIPLDTKCPGCRQGKAVPAVKLAQPKGQHDALCQVCGRVFAPTHWRLRVYAGARTAAGNPRWVSQQFRGTKAQAQTALANLVTERVTDRDWREHNATVPDLMERWITHIEARGATGYTVTDYRRKVANHVVPALGSVRLTKLSAAQLDRAYDAWGAGGLAPASVRKLHSMLAAALHQAVRWGWLKTSPTDRARPPSVPRLDRGMLSVEQVRALRERAAADDGDEGAMLPTAILLGALTGARRGELCSLRWSDIDPAAGVVHIRRSLTVLAGGKWHEGETKTRQRRDVPLDDRAFDELEKRRTFQLWRAEMYGTELVKDPFVLSRDVTGSGPCLPNGLTHDFRDLADQLGLGFHFHDLRHYTSSMGLASGMDPVTVAKHVGHADPKMTLTVYGHVVPAQARELARKMSDTLGLPG